MPTSSRGGASGQKTPAAPPIRLGRSQNTVEKGATDTGFDPLHALGVALHAVVHGTASPAERKAQAAFEKAHPVSGAPLYTPVTALVDQAAHLPSMLKAAHETAVRIAHPSAKNPPSLKQNVEGLLGGAFGFPQMRTKYEPRTLTHGELEQQLPKARSQVTQVGEKLVDKASTALQGSKFVRDTPGLRLVTSGERVAKAAGRSQRIERGRAAAPLVEHVNAIRAVKEGSPEDQANFWYSQLPVSHRNAQGLSLVRAKQADELARITAGKALEDLTARESAVKVQMGAAPDAKTKLPFLRDLEEIKILKSDLPQRADDTAASIGQLDKLIAEPPAANTAAIQAVHALGGVRQSILEASGRLKADRAEPRKGLVSRWLGVKPSSEEAYIGHRLPKPDSSGAAYMPSGGVGRVASPKGVGSENRLILASTGRLRQSLHVAVEDHASAQVFHQANVARDDLAKIGTPFTGKIQEGDALVNPKGRTVPAHWRNEELAQFRDGYEDTDHIREQAKEILDGFIATDRAGFEKMKQDALEQGVSWGELRVVPRRLVDRYYAQFRAGGGRSTPTKVYDSLIDAVATSIVFARVGYIPKNFVQNLVMAVPHQGPMLLVNAVRAAQAMKDPELRHFFQAEVGHTGPTGSLGAEAFTQKILGKIASGVGKVADDPIRFSAFLHEAAAEGVISKVDPFLGEKDRAALLKLFTAPAQRPLLNDIRSRSVEAMADFSRMTPAQSKLARRFLIIPGWLMAGTRYPFHFALTHPIRSALLAYIAMGEPNAPAELHFNKPLSEYFSGQGYKQGIDTPIGRIRTNSLSPVSTPYDLAQGVAGTIRGKQGPFDYQTPTVFDSVQPLAAAAINIAQGAGVEKSLTRLAPNYQFVGGMIHPAASPSYPEDASRLGRLKRELGVVPIKVADSSAPFKAAQFKDKLLQAMQKVGQQTLPENVSAALDVRAHRQEEIDKSGTRSARGKFAVDIATLIGMGRMNATEAQKALQWSKKATDRNLKSARRYLASHYFDGKLLSETVSYLNKNAGTDLRLP